MTKPNEQSFTRMAGRVCITTACDSNYMDGVVTLFKTIRRYTDCTGIDFKVITADQAVVDRLGAENCHVVTDEIRARYSNVKYSKDLPESKYHTSWYRYEMFSFEGYDRVICIDSDCLCIQDISYLFSEELNEFDIISVEDHIVSKCFTKLVPELEAQGLNFKRLRERMKDGKIDVQPALLVANKTIVNKVWYHKLLAYANATDFTYSIDEGILNDFIYIDNLRIKLLPLEWDYQDLYEIHCPELQVPTHPVIVHCQESKPFRKPKDETDPRTHKWHDRWWLESRFGEASTLVVILVWNRFENLIRWINCWNQCDRGGAELVVIHNLGIDNDRYENLCRENGIRYVPRENIGFDLGAFQDVCMERLHGFPNNWENLIWITDDCFPMAKDFVAQYLAVLQRGALPCYEISDEVKRHVRTTGVMVTKEISKKLTFPCDPIRDREDCYLFEHKGVNMLEQLVSMGVNPSMVSTDLMCAPLWDSGCRSHLGLMQKHEQVFCPACIRSAQVVSEPKLGDLDAFAIKHKADKSSLYHNFAVKYDRLFGGIRESVRSVLEIGVAQGQSLRMWADYFPSALIHGADISEASRAATSYSNRIKFHLADQGNISQLKNLEQFSPFDIIIDDGNHFWKEQILSFNTLFSYVRKGGIYVIEDSCTSYWKEYMNHPISCVDHFKMLVDAVNLRGARGRPPSNPPPDFTDWNNGWHRREDCHTLPEFESIHFMNAVIVIYKRL
jgi:lipopolysaccharide biosynthesis glycosyltransferase